MRSLILIISLCFASLISVANADDVIWIDVRSAAEFSGGAVDGAINIPHDVIADKIAAVVGNKDSQINLYCRSGRRAGWAMESLNKLGYSQVNNLGGYEQAKAAYQKQ